MAIKGKDLSFTIDGTEYKAQVTNVVLDNEEADDDVTTFADVAAGGSRTWFIELEAVSDYGTDSFWTYLWENSGEEVPFVLKPYGNTTPSAAQPHFTGNAVVGPKPRVGGTAGETFTFEYRMDVSGTPNRVVA